LCGMRSDACVDICGKYVHYTAVPARVGSRNTVDRYGGGFRGGVRGVGSVCLRGGVGGWVGGGSAGVWAGRALGGLRAIVFASVVLRRLLVACVRAAFGDVSSERRP
jgi:hypothetical protein